MYDDRAVATGHWPTGGYKRAGKRQPVYHPTRYHSSMIERKGATWLLPMIVQAQRFKNGKVASLARYLEPSPWAFI
jgi:hypothetical protein